MAAQFDGARPGRVFKLGAEGLGYYRDAGSAAAASQFEGDSFRRALDAEASRSTATAGAGAAIVDDGPDAPIVAALGSHREGLADASAQTARLEAEAAHGVSAGLKHAAQVLEVRLTDQLLMLDAMLGDCETSEGRVAVKAVVADLRGLGTRLVRISSRR